MIQERAALFEEDQDSDISQLSGISKSTKSNEPFELNEESVKEINSFLLNLNDEQVYDTRLAYIMTKLLQGVVLNGTGRKAKDISSFLGGKTGTTNLYIDALFVGFSANVVTGVWTGFDSNETLGWGETGAKSALPIWRSYMKDYLKKYGELDFKAPSGIINVLIDKKKGVQVEDKVSDVMMEVFVEGTEPGNVDADADEIILDNQEKEGEKTSILEDDAFFNVQ